MNKTERLAPLSHELNHIGFGAQQWNIFLTSTFFVNWLSLWFFLGYPHRLLGSCWRNYMHRPHTPWSAPAFRLWAHTERVQVYCTAPGWINGGRIRCPSHEKTLALIDLFFSFLLHIPSGCWVDNWPWPFWPRFMAKVSCLWDQREEEKKNVCQLVASMTTTAWKAARFYYRRRKRRCSLWEMSWQRKTSKRHYMNFSFS